MLKFLTASSIWVLVSREYFYGVATCTETCRGSTVIRTLQLHGGWAFSVLGTAHEHNICKYSNTQTGNGDYCAVCCSDLVWFQWLSTKNRKNVSGIWWYDKLKTRKYVHMMKTGIQTEWQNNVKITREKLDELCGEQGGTSTAQCKCCWRQIWTKQRWVWLL
jgi:hypothetical protein